MNQSLENKAVMFKSTDSSHHSNKHLGFETSKINENYKDTLYDAAQATDTQGTPTRSLAYLSTIKLRPHHTPQH